MHNAELIIHNSSFDLKFINCELELLSKNTLSTHEVIDTLKMARKLFPGMPSSLDALCKRYKIDISKRVKHGALLDAELLAEVYLEMQGGRQQGIELVSKKKEIIELKEEKDSLNYSKKIYSLNSEELKKHEFLIKMITEN